jgi:hypothetical protein
MGISDADSGQAHETRSGDRASRHGIVVGVDGSDSSIVGSVSAYCTEHAGCPVVVVHQPAVGAQK